MSQWCNPLPTCMWSLGLGKYNPFGFGSHRHTINHTGIDIKAAPGSIVYAVEDGEVVGIFNFIKNRQQSKAVMIEGKSGVCLYGNVKLDSGVETGATIEANQMIGVLGREKENGVVCLHFELHRHGSRQRIYWEANKKQPSKLMDPTSKLLSTITTKKRR